MNIKLLLIFLIFHSLTNAQCWQTISAGNGFNQMIKNDNTLWAFGGNTSGRLGDGTTTNRNSPVNIDNNSTWIAISGGNNFTVGIKSNGTLWTWGASFGGPNPLQVGTENNWQKISAGGFHILAIKNDGTLWSFGQNNKGQLGINTIVNNYTPTQVGTSNDWLHISAGGYHSVAIKTDGTLWSWGDNLSGQLGDNGFANYRTTPYQVGTANDWLSISCGGGSASVLAMKTNHTIWGWGNNAFGGLGLGSTTDKDIPTQIGTANDWQSIQTGYFHTMAIKNNGTLWACGYNIYGQLGDGTTTNRTTLIQIGTETNWQEVYCGGNHTTGKKTDGTLLTWGRNNNGQLGDATFIDKYVPTQINVCTNLEITEVNLEDSFKIYPNPVKNYLNFESATSIDKIELFDLLGRQTASMEITNNQLDLSFLSSGTYFLKFYTEEEIKIYKIIKE